MKRPVTLLGAPSSIGIRPYDDGRQRRLDLAPLALREKRLAERLGARDAGDVTPPAYEDFARNGSRPRNEAGLVAYSTALARRVAEASADGAFVVVLGGDCSVVLGSLLGARAGRSRIGLVYADAHADFATPEESLTGSAASMCLALAVGRGNSPLARLSNPPLVRPEDVVLMGRRDQAEPWYGHSALRESAILDLPHAALRELGPRDASRKAMASLGALDGFWIHLDADLLDPRDLPAVDSPEPGGFRVAEVAELLTPLVRHPRALGLEVTIYDPELDPHRRSAAVLASLLETLLAA